MDWTKIESYLATLTPQRRAEIEGTVPPNGLATLFQRFIDRKKP